MAVRLFILGLPGSGKSTISRYIVDYVQKQHRRWSPSRLNDYAILHEMFLADTKHEKFRPTEKYDGFDVLDFSLFDTALSVIDTALKEMEKRAKEAIRASDKVDLILIEFARNDYRRAFAQFNDDFVRDAYFLYLKAKIPICKLRVRARVADPHTEDDHYVSEEIFKSYYHKNNAHQLYSSLKKNQVRD